jgi:uncharacterized protein YndB with AHSA1/START domain
VRRTIGAPIEAVFDWCVDANNYRSMPGVLRVQVHPADGAEPNGVGAIREMTNLAERITEEVTAYERPHRMSYVIRSSIPPQQHDGATLSFQETNKGTEVTWTTSFKLKIPILADVLTRLYAPMLALGVRMFLHAADRRLTR